ncbi:MAG: hypothetical protein RLZZ500_1171 [Bacteroidota bacterium]|jgi:hypothetical protein
MQLQTIVPIQSLPQPIDYHSKIVCLGSCFAEHMSVQLTDHGFATVTNPFGIIFNALSIQRLVTRIVHNQKFTEDAIFLHNELYQSYEIHSELSTTQPDLYLSEINNRLETTREAIRSATHLILTLGTSWVYTHQGEVVANCHKVPNFQFEKKLISAIENEQALFNCIELVRQLNPTIQFIFTVSPVRHSKDGFLENHLSKGNLLQAIYNLKQKDSELYYFPAYEIVMDELRDYRFFAADLIHPNVLAIAYVWERFKTYGISNESYPIMKEVVDLKRALQHRPQHENTQAWAQFQQQLTQKIANFNQRFPHILLESN